MNIVKHGINNTASVSTEASGAQWVKRFPGSRSTADLANPFRGRVEAFIGAIRAAGATVVINGTLRDLRRAYLMHWSWRIVKAHVDPQSIPSMNGVCINWSHLDRSGNYSRVASIAGASEMVKAFGMERLGVAPSLTSRHIIGSAIDISISWQGNLLIVDSLGNTVEIKTPPWSGMNLQLHRVGESYGVIKYNRRGRDEPHWSDNGT